MSDETTEFIVGDAAIDALSRSKRRRWFRSSKPERVLTHCENCEAPLTGPYCSKCGQHAIDYRRSFMQVMIDAADSFFDWDTKFVRSIGVLLIKPWQLTNDFNSGKRARFVHPLRLYLLASITFFLVAKLLSFQTSGALEFRPEDRAALDATLMKLAGPNSPLSADERAQVQTALGRLNSPEASLTREEQKIIRAAVKKPPGVSVAGLNDERERTREALRRVPNATPTPKPSVAADFIGPRLPALSPGEGDATPTESAPAQKNAFVTFDGDEGSGIDKPNTPFEKWMEERIKTKIGKDGSKGQLFLETLRSNVPTMMLFCIPIFAVILKVLYVRKKRHYIEHLVYALHVHSFVYLAVVLIVLLAMGANRTVPALSGWLIGLLVSTTCVLVFFSIRRVYKQGWIMSIVKFLIGGLAYLMVLALGIGATALITLMLPD
ncbi:MAG: DUF3667 domain-containing protein [Chthoniobacterales bacterium]